MYRGSHDGGRELAIAVCVNNGLWQMLAKIAVCVQVLLLAIASRNHCMFGVLIFLKELRDSGKEIVHDKSNPQEIEFKNLRCIASQL